MDVVTAEQAKIAESAGACCVMALERIPADIKQEYWLKLVEASLACRIPDSSKKSNARSAFLSWPKQGIHLLYNNLRIGHFGEADILEALKVDCIDESEVLTAADKVHQPQILPGTTRPGPRRREFLHRPTNR